jgi:hypothetical protein
MKECSTTHYQCKKVLRNHDHHKFNRDMVWRFKVKKLALGYIMDSDLKVCHNMILYFILKIHSFLI